MAEAESGAHFEAGADSGAGVRASAGAVGAAASGAIDALPLSGSRALVVTCSTRAATGAYPDRGGPLIADWLRERGSAVEGPLVVPDGPDVGAAIAGGVAAAYDLIVTTGGTGCSPTDVTPEQTKPLLDKEIAGIAEAIRAAGVAAGVSTAMLSRGLAGLAGRTVVVNLPGSTGGVRDALGVLDGVVAHLLSQVRGGDHG